MTRGAFLALGLVLATQAHAQRRSRGGGDFGFQQLGDANSYYTPPDFNGNPAYDGRFVFARIKYRGFLKWAGKEGPGWAHDYPDADEHLMLIMRDITDLRPFIRSGPIVGGAIVALDDPALFKYPVGYVSEPGGWFPNDKEAEGLRNYLLKGGFVIFDDFREGYRWGPDWSNLQAQMQRVMPTARWVQLTGKESIFDSFYKIDLAKIEPPYAKDLTPSWWAIYENNDPKKRIMVIANVNNDIGEFWQWSGQGFFSVDDTNEAFKLGINFLIYALTH